MVMGTHERHAISTLVMMKSTYALPGDRNSFFNFRELLFLLLHLSYVCVQSGRLSLKALMPIPRAC